MTCAGAGFADCDRQEGALPNFKVRFMDSVKVTGRKVNLAYSHALRERKTTVDGSVELNAENKVAVSHVLGTEDCKLKYTFARGKLPVVEPAYDLKERAWAVAVSRKFDGGDAVRGRYESKNRKLEMEWSRTFRDKGSFKVYLRNPPVNNQQMCQISLLPLVRNKKICPQNNGWTSEI